MLGAGLANGKRLPTTSAPVLCTILRSACYDHSKAPMYTILHYARGAVPAHQTWRKPGTAACNWPEFIIELLLPSYNYNK